jgi:arylsulfatase A-like enzyme
MIPTKVHVKSFFYCFLLFLIAASAEGQQKPSGSRPNIIFIMADDLGYGDLGCYGQTKIRTPNIDRLAQEGIRFTQAYAGGPVCTPSRSVLMTGLHNGHTPARDNIPHYHTYLQEDDMTLAEVLKANGYRTGGVGKWSLGDAGTVGRATNQGFDMWLGYLNQDHAHYYYTEYLDYNESRLDLSGNGILREHYSHDVLTNGALQFIRESNSDPFFLYVAYTIPHFSSKTEDIDGLTVPSLEPYEDKDWPAIARKYAAMVHMLDRDVGKIVQLIEDMGLRNNTLIIFTSDNGGHDSVWDAFNTSGPLRGHKRDLTEGGIRVPFIAAWPGMIPAKTVSNEIIAFQDMMPTFAELSGAGVIENTDGISVVEALMGNPLANDRPYLYWDYGHNRDAYLQAVRKGNWKCIRNQTTGDVWLYDLSKDIGEQHNLADQYSSVVVEMEQIMKEAFVPSDRYPVGQKYLGGPILRRDH